MNRREMLLTTGAAALGLSAFPFGWAAAADKKKQKVLYFTRSAGFVHPMVASKEGEMSLSDKVLTELGQKNGFDVVCTKDGAVFDGDLDQYDCIAFYTSGDLTGKCEKPQPGAAMSPEGKKKFMAAIEAGKGFVGIHSATDSFRTKAIDPYIAMIGGEFRGHDAQQKAKNKVVDPKFPGTAGLGDGFEMEEEWYSYVKFAPDLHVILVQETEGMKGRNYQRPPYPATWARMQGKGRVFYTSLGHRDDVIAGPTFAQVLLGGLSWTMRNVEADVTPNIAQVTPGANELRRPAPPES
jgi:type 1 glutamine amidotransferase